jgi:hypothetical protein
LLGRVYGWRGDFLLAGHTHWIKRLSSGHYFTTVGQNSLLGIIFIVLQADICIWTEITLGWTVPWCGKVFLGRLSALELAQILLAKSIITGERVGCYRDRVLHFWVDSESGGSDFFCWVSCILRWE